MLTSAQKRLCEEAGYRPVVLAIHLDRAFDNYAQADLKYEPEIQLKMLEGYLSRLEQFLNNAVQQNWVIFLTSLEGGPMWLDTYHPSIKAEVAKLHSHYKNFIDNLVSQKNIYRFLEANAGDACSDPEFIKILSGIDNPRMYVIGGFESGCLLNTTKRLQGRLDIVKIPNLIFDENFEDDYKRL